MSRWIIQIAGHQIDSRQFGSIKRSSTAHALVEMTHSWMKALDSPGNMVQILLLDFGKAFDRVDHTLLLNKMAALGMPGFLLQWLTVFLTDRRLRVKMGHIESEWRQVNAGVPQGTLLGPILFLFHINDLRTSSDMAKYVDDSTLWEVSSTSDLNRQLQMSADEARDWADSNKMILNCDKTKHMVMCFARKPPTVPPLVLDNVVIERVQHAKLLGVVVSCDLKWQKHVDYVCGKASQRLYFLRMLKRAGVELNDIVRIYTSLVRSVLEYACQVWHTGLTSQQSDQLEAIQRRALRIIHPDKSYNEALGLTKLNTLQDRRTAQAKAFFTDMLRPTHKLHYLIPLPREHGYNLRFSRLNDSIVNTGRFRDSLIQHGLINWQ